MANNATDNWVKRLFLALKEFWRLIQERNLVWLSPVFIVLMPLILVGLLFAEKSKTQRASESTRGGAVHRSVGLSPPSPELVAENYIHNFELIKAICERRGVRYIGSLQPVMGIHTPPYSDYDRRITAYKNAEQTGEWSNIHYYQAFYNDLIEHAVDGENLFDLTGVFDECQQQIYFDSVHFADIGQDIVAAKLAEIVLEK